jgi:hypothetical protein
MAERIPNGVAKKIVFRAIASADHFTPATAKTIAITISKNGATSFSNPAAGATNATEMASGFYKFDLGTGDTDTNGPLAWRGAGTGVDDVGDVVEVVAATNAGFTGVPAAVAGASGGLIINGSNTGAVTLNGLTTGALATSNVAITGTLSTSGTTTFNALTVTNATTLSGAVSFGSTWGITGATTFTGAVGATNASNDIRGILLQATQTGVTIPTVTTTTTATNLTNDAAKYMHGAVWIDTVNGAAGTASYTNGIVTNPCSTLASAKTIADNLKIKRFWTQSGSALTLAAAYVGYVFDGAGYTLALGTQDISKAIIHNVEGLSGTATCPTGEAVVFDCHISGATTIGEVDFNRCHLMATVTMSQASVPYLFNQCVGVSSAKITFAAASQTAVISKWSGPLTIAGMVSTNILYLDGDGDVTFDNTNNTGTVYISGNIRLTNNGTSMAITDSSRWGEDQTIAVATNLTNLPAITSNWLTAAGIAASALNGKGDWNIGKTGYSLTQTFPTNFSATVISAGGLVDVNVQKINDVTITGDGQSGTEFGV